MSGKEWPDITIVCSHGIAEHHADFVQLFRFMANQDVWVPVRRRTTTTQSLTGNKLYSMWDSAPAQSPVRERFSIKCHKCQREVAARRTTLEYVFYRLAGFGITAITLNDLQPALARVHKDLR